MKPEVIRKRLELELERHGTSVVFVTPQGVTDSAGVLTEDAVEEPVRMFGPLSETSESAVDGFTAAFIAVASAMSSEPRVGDRIRLSSKTFIITQVQVTSLEGQPLAFELACAQQPEPNV